MTKGAVLMAINDPATARRWVETGERVFGLPGTEDCAWETLSDREKCVYLAEIHRGEVLMLTAEDMARVAPYLLNPRFDYTAARYECDPSSTEPYEIRAACIAEKLLNA